MRDGSTPKMTGASITLKAATAIPLRLVGLKADWSRIQVGESNLTGKGLKPERGSGRSRITFIIAQTDPMTNNNRSKKNHDSTGIVRVVLYARVSTRDKQECENQLLQLREYCQRAGYVIVKEYIDHESGSNGDRRQFRAMFEGARLRQFEIVIFWALDRFTREGTRKTLEYLTQLEGWQVKFQSLTQSWIDSAGPFRDVVISIMATLAQQERKLISDRVTAGLSRARQAGTVIGRPASILNAEALCKEAETTSLAKLARKHGSSKATISRRINAWKAQHA